MSEIDQTSSSPHSPITKSLEAWRQVLLVVGAGLVVVMTLLLVPIPLERHRGVGAFGDLMHAPIFGSLTYGILALLDRCLPLVGWPRRFWVRLIAVALSVFFFGVAAEIFQSFTGRSPSLHDAIANGLGVLVAVAWFVRRRLQSNTPSAERQRISQSLGFIAVALLMAAWCYPALVLTDVVMVHLRFPMISSFETSMQKDCWYFRNADAALTNEHVTDGQYALEMTVQPKRLTGCTCFEMHGDWSSMQSLKLDVRLDDKHPQETATLTIQIADHRHDDPDLGRFQRSVEITRGQWETIEISRSELADNPSASSLELSSIRYLDLFFLSPPVVTKVIIDNVRIVQ